jgi:hypothetical protein
MAEILLRYQVRRDKSVTALVQSKSALLISVLVSKGVL